MDLVSVIILTSQDRKEMFERCIAMYRAQDYENKEVIIVNDEGYTRYRSTLSAEASWGINEPKKTIGAKRNIGVQVASADSKIIIPMDDDDLYLPDWITSSVNALIKSGADIVGLSSCYFHNTATNAIHSFDRNPNAQLYMPEATLCYWRKTWERNPFPDTSAGEGMAFLANGGRLHAHGYKEGFLATIHGSNTCSHKSLPLMKKVAPNECDRLLKHFYNT